MRRTSIGAALVITFAALTIPAHAAPAVPMLTPSCGKGTVALKQRPQPVMADGAMRFEFYDRTGTGTSWYVVPPRSFDPRSATAATLESYGLPKRPLDAGQLTQWLPIVTGLPSITPWVPCESLTAKAATRLYTNWSGAINLRGSGAALDAVQSRFVIPATTAGCTAGTHTTWVGLGGSHPSEGLIQAGVNTVEGNGNGRAWYEWLSPQSSVYQQLTSLYVGTGETAWAYADYDPSTTHSHYRVDNLSRGTSTGVVVKALGRAFWQGNTAEYISERLLYDDGYSPLYRHGPVSFSQAQARRLGGGWSGGGTIGTDIAHMVNNGRRLETADYWSGTGSFQTRWASCS